MSLARSAAYYSANPYWGYEPMRGTWEFHKSKHIRRLLRAPNQVSKSISGAVEAWAALIGEYPPSLENAPVPPSSGIVLVADLDNVFPELSEKLREVAPMDRLDPACRYISGKGWMTNGRRMIRARNGCTMTFRGGGSETTALAAATKGWAWIDEPPKQHHLGELMSRVAVKEGRVWATLTPIGRPVHWFRVRVEGDPETGSPAQEDWEQHRPKLTQADCTTITGRIIRSTASIAKQVASYDEWEIPQRVRGEWEGVTTGRRMRHFSPACLVGDAHLAELEYETFRVGIDHGEGLGRQYAVLGGKSRNRYVLIREWRGGESCIPLDVAEGILGMLASAGITVYDLERIVGDINTAGLGVGGGVKYNLLIEQAIEKVIKKRLPEAIGIPNKRSGSVGAGEVAMNAAMRDGLWLVHEGCQHFISAAKNYTGAEADLKDRIDAARYCFDDFLLAPTVPEHQPRLVL